MLKSRYIFALALIIFIGLWGTMAVAQTSGPVVLTDEQDQYPLGLQLEILVDKDKEWTIEDVTSSEIASQFEPSQEAVPGFGFTDSAYWVRFQVRNEANSDTDWVLLYEPAAFFVDYYFPKANGEGFDAIHTGSALPFATRDLPVRQFAFQVPISPQDSKTIYMRFASEGTLILSLALISGETFAQQSLSQRTINGILYGILLILIVYNLSFFVTLREKSYLYYVFFFGSMLMAIMSLDGIAAQYIWPYQGLLAAIALRFFMVLAFTFALLFATSYLQTKDSMPRLHKIMISLAIANIVFLGLQYSWFRETAVIHVLLMLASSLSLIIAGLIAWQRGYKPARYFFIGWAIILVGFTIFVLTIVDVLPLTPVSDGILRIGLVMLALVLSFGLSERIDIYRQEKTQAVVEERSRLARDLHDSVTQSLYSATLLAEVLPGINRRDPTQAEQGLEDLRYLTRGALAEMRTMLLELRPETLVKTPLGDLLVQLAEALTARMEIQTEVNIQPIPDLPPNVNLNFYRIAQESLNNVVKHSQAGAIALTLASAPPYSVDKDSDWQGTVILEVQDDGIGFDHREILPYTLGLGIMRERSTEIDADLVVESQTGWGTKIRLAWEGSSAGNNNSAG